MDLFAGSDPVSKMGFIGPGMTGPRVEELQTRIGVAVTGVYDDTTTQKVRGLQVLHGLPMRDGIYDPELDAKLVGVSR